jgi:hypothetical protein
MLLKSLFGERSNAKAAVVYRPAFRLKLLRQWSMRHNHDLVFCKQHEAVALCGSAPSP